MSLICRKCNGIGGVFAADQKGIHDRCALLEKIEDLTRELSAMRELLGTDIEVGTALWYLRQARVLYTEDARYGGGELAPEMNERHRARILKLLQQLSMNPLIVER